MDIHWDFVVYCLDFKYGLHILNLNSGSEIFDKHYKNKIINNMYTPPLHKFAKEPIYHTYTLGVVLIDAVLFLIYRRIL